MKLPLAKYLYVPLWLQLSLYVLLPSQRVYAETVLDSDAPHVSNEVHVILKDSVEHAPQTAVSDEPKTSRLERWVRPLTRWAEDQIHDSSLVRTPNKEHFIDKQETISLRDAIDIAKSRHPGMVLGAVPQHKEQRLFYEIRIISDSGVIKTIVVDGIAKSNALNHSEGSP